MALSERAMHLPNQHNGATTKNLRHHWQLASTSPLLAESSLLQRQPFALVQTLALYSVLGPLLANHLPLYVVLAGLGPKSRTNSYLLLAGSVPTTPFLACCTSVLPLSLCTRVYPVSPEKHALHRHSSVQCRCPVRTSRLVCGDPLSPK